MKNIRTTDVRVNYNNKTIVITKKYAKKVENPLTAEFDEFMKLRAKLSDFDVIVRTPSRKAKRDSLKGLNYDFMRQYIERHEGENSEAMAEFTKMTIRDDDSLATLSYGEVKKWFLEKYPSVAKAA